MGLILSEPIKNVVKISKILAKTSVEDAETHPKVKKQMQKEDGAGKRKSAKRQKEKEKSGRGQKHGKKNGVLAGGLCFFLPWVHPLPGIHDRGSSRPGFCSCRAASAAYGSESAAWKDLKSSASSITSSAEGIYTALLASWEMGGGGGSPRPAHPRRSHAPSA
jgi:hypothetical protein